MLKYRNNNVQMNEKEKIEQISKSKKINHNSIIDKIHSIQASLNNNNKPKLIKRKNNFRRINEPKFQDNLMKNRTKSKNKIRSKSKIKNMSKTRIIDDNKEIKNNKKIKSNSFYW